MIAPGARKIVKEYDIKVGFHDHPKQANNPAYKMWDPNYVLSVLEGRDARIGSCADKGTGTFGSPVITLRWMPNGKRLSFVHGTTLYTVPAE